MADIKIALPVEAYPWLHVVTTWWSSQRPVHVELGLISQLANDNNSVGLLALDGTSRIRKCRDAAHGGSSKEDAEDADGTNAAAQKDQHDDEEKSSCSRRQITGGLGATSAGRRAVAASLASGAGDGLSGRHFARSDVHGFAGLNPVGARAEVGASGVTTTAAWNISGWDARGSQCAANGVVGALAVACSV